MVGRCSILTSQPKDSSMEAHPVWGFWRSFSSMSLGTNSLLFTYHDNWQLDKALIAYLSIFCTLQDQYLINTDNDEDDSLDSSSSIIFTWQSPPPKVKSEAALDICCIFSEIASISNSLPSLLVDLVFYAKSVVIDHNDDCTAFENMSHIQQSACSKENTKVKRQEHNLPLDNYRSSEWLFGFMSMYLGHCHFLWPHRHRDHRQLRRHDCHDPQ